VRALARQLSDGAVRLIDRGIDDRTTRCIRIGDRDPIKALTPDLVGILTILVVGIGVLR
jgi:hypothetical protein